MYINPDISSLSRIQPESGRSEYLRLDMNENPVGLPEEFVNRVLIKITPEKLATYPETDETIDVISKNLKIHSACIALSNGSDEVLKTIFAVFGERGKKLVAVTPSFAMYPIYAQMAGMKHTVLSYNEDFEMDINSILEQINEDTGIISLVNPNNPMGNVYSKEEVECILHRAQQVGALVIIDEAYFYFYNHSFVLLTKKYDNLIVTRTFSKLCSIAGLRIGYAVASPKIISLLNAARPTYCVNVVALEFAKEILSDEKLVYSLIEQERKGREWVVDRMRQIGYSVICKEGNFLFIKTNRDAEEIEQSLRSNKVLVKTYNCPQLKGYIRISTGNIKSMERFLKIFIRLDK